MSNRLKTEVWELNNCTGCGLCVAACSKQVLFWDGEEHPILQKRIKNIGYSRSYLDSCSFCQKFCEEVCPRLERWMPIEAHHILAARARGPVKSGAPNDIIRAILAAGRSAGLIDGVVMLDLNPWNMEPKARIADSVEEIVDNLGPQYLWAPVFAMLNEAIFDRRMENLAIVGPPCTAQAIRKLRTSSNQRLSPYQDSIRLSISTFCTGIYKPELIEEVIVQQMGLNLEQIKRLEVSPDRQWLQVVLWDNSQRFISRQTAEQYTRSGCGTCDDYLGESADLAIGKLGAPDDFSTVIIRSRIGDIFARNTIQMNLLETGPAVDLESLSVASSIKDRRERGQAFKDLQVLALDALSDPIKHNEAVSQFVRLFRTPIRAAAIEQTRNGCTGC